MLKLSRRGRIGLAILLGAALLAAGSATYAITSGGGESRATERFSVFETIDDDDLPVPMTFRRVEAAGDATVLSEAELRDRVGAGMDVAMRESPKLVEIVNNAMSGVAGLDGPLWAVFPDIPPLGGPVPEGVETYVLYLYDARTGELLLEFGGPIVDGENEWHPDFPREMRYTREDQIS